MTKSDVTRLKNIDPWVIFTLFQLILCNTLTFTYNTRRILLVTFTSKNCRPNVHLCNCTQRNWISFHWTNKHVFVETAWRSTASISYAIWPLIIKDCLELKGTPSVVYSLRNRLLSSIFIAVYTMKQGCWRGFRKVLRDQWLLLYARKWRPVIFYPLFLHILALWIHTK